MFDGQSRLAQNAVEDLWLERPAGMDGYDQLLPWDLTTAKGDMATDLVILVPSGTIEAPNEPIPGKIPWEPAHTATSTVTSSTSVSSGIGSPCLTQLSR